MSSNNNYHDKNNDSKKAIYLSKLRGKYAQEYFICPQCAYTIKATAGQMRCSNCGQGISVNYRKGHIKL